MSTSVDDTIYFEKLVQSVTRIIRHAYYPGKDETVERCLEEIDDLEEMGRISSEQRAALRELLVGEEDRALVEGMIRERLPAEALADSERIAVFCEGTGSLGAFSAGVLEGLLERTGDRGQIVGLGGTGFGALSAVMAWDGLLRQDRGRAIGQLQQFWREYSAASLLDSLVNYSTQMVLHLRSLIPVSGPGPVEVSPFGLDQLCRLVERQVDCAQACFLAAGEGSCGLAVNAVDRQGRIEVVRGPEIRLQPLVAAAASLHWLTAFCGTEAADPLAPATPVRALLDSTPGELLLIQVRRAGRARPACSAGELADFHERHEHQMLDQELRFVQTINRLIKKGLLLGDRYRPVEVHRIVMEHDFDDSARVNRSPGLIDGLISYGRERASQFLEKRQLGLARGAPGPLER
jgi:hypothetical protein